tara:strand:- start:415 stop:561 length:147 start_codon:yes stop_codon:yes gene_type:complete
MNKEGFNSGNILPEKILDKIYDVLVRIEKHLLKYEPKKEKPKKQLLND